ncbi:UNVERIFIED_CONTAM: hypothetical protein K2H54_058843 [Gekko kuhli]
MPCWANGQWINLVSRMKLVPVALFYLGSVSFFGVEAAELDVASDFKRRGSRGAPSRVRRGATLSEAAAAADAPSSLVHVREARGEPSRRQEGRRRPKRQDPNAVFHTYLRMSCNLGTCVTAKLMDQIYHLNNKDKDPNAPPRKISPQGYGRRRRSLLDVVGALKSSSSSSRRLSERRRRRMAPPFQALRALQ